VEIYTQYIYERTWQRTSQKDALRMIEEEMPEADAKGTLDYILKEIQKGKTITLGECRFKSSTERSSIQGVLNERFFR